MEIDARTRYSLASGKAMRYASKVVATALALGSALPFPKDASPVALPEPPPRVLPPAPPTPLELARQQVRALGWKAESVSTGRPYQNGARLRNSAALPMEGPGYYVLRPERNTHFGTDDLVAGLIETAAALREEDPAAPPLAVGDLSGPRGGRVALHVSHRSGRDADLLFFWTDARGAPTLTEEFVGFDAAGRGRWLRRTVRFDAARNWRLVRALLVNARVGARVSCLFVWGPLRERLLARAKAVETDRALLERARRVLVASRERDGRHNDHFHLRLACSAREAARGCRD